MPLTTPPPRTPTGRRRNIRLISSAALTILSPSSVSAATSAVLSSPLSSPRGKHSNPKCSSVKCTDPCLLRRNACPTLASLDVKCVAEDPSASSCCSSKVHWLVSPPPFGDADDEQNVVTSTPTTIQIDQCPNSKEEAVALIADLKASKDSTTMVGSEEEGSSKTKAVKNSNTRGFTSTARSVLSMIPAYEHSHDKTTADLLLGVMSDALLNCSNVHCIDQCSAPENQCQYLVDQEYECVNVGRTQHECCPSGVEWFKDGEPSFSSCPRGPSGGLRR